MLTLPGIVMCPAKHHLIEEDAQPVLKDCGLQSGARGYDSAVRILATTLVLIAALVAATASPSVADSPARAATHCKNIGQPGTDTGLYGIQARHISCKSTRRILNKWFHDASEPDIGPQGWHCRRHAAGEISFRTRCSHKHARIAFTQYSE
jgi:hypothetical protein